MAGLSNAASDDVYNLYMKAIAPTPPANVFVALYTVAPTDAGGGTEVSGGAYARASTAPADWSTPTDGSGSNVNEITFIEATASWGTVLAFALFDAVTAGNFIGWGTLTPKLIDNQDQARFKAGDFTANFNAN